MKIHGYSNAHDLKAILQSAYGAGQRVKLAKNNSIAVYDKPTSVFGRFVNWLREVTGRNRREHAQVVLAFQRLVDLEPSIDRRKQSQSFSDVQPTKLRERTASVPSSSEASTSTHVASNVTPTDSELIEIPVDAQTPPALDRFRNTKRAHNDKFQQKLTPISEENESELDKESLVFSEISSELTANSSETTPSNEPITENQELLIPSKVQRTFLEREKDVAAAREFATNLHKLKTKDWEREVQEYLSDLQGLAKETSELELSREIDEVIALIEYKLDLPHNQRDTNQFINKYIIAAPQSLTISSEQAGENLQDVLSALAPNKSIDQVHTQLKEYKASCQRKANIATKNASDSAHSSHITGTSASTRISRDPHVLAATKELELASSVLTSIEIFRDQQETKLGFLQREDTLRQAQEAYNNHEVKNAVLDEIEIEKTIQSLAEIGSEAERVASLAVATDEQRKLELDLRAQVIELILKFQALERD